jgi:hypothetical protein
VPADVMKHPSRKRITRRVTTKDATGATVSQDFPFYQASDNEVVMNARPGESVKPDFVPLPKKPKDLSPEDDAMWDQWLEDNRRLPTDVETACQPANDKGEDLFDFNMLHELAHAIDDANNFMVARENQSAFGGWITHGGDVDTIAAAVAEAKKFGKTTEQIAYVAALVSRSQAIVPDRPDEGGDEFDRAKNAVDAWYAEAVTDNVWDSDAASARLVVGDRIYHQAYPDTWVSYLATARKRGITSYQFRAPGEWFSELYAAFKSGKLKPEHPSRAWLAKLSI